LKKIVGFFILMLLITTAIPSVGIMNEIRNRNTISIKYNSLNGGWIERYDDFVLLHVNGSHYDMGYQHGYLLSDEIMESYLLLLDWSESGGWYHDFYVWLWSELEDYVSQDYKDELQGIADGSGMSFINISICNIILEWIHCSVAAAWGAATSDGKLIYMRSFDFPLGWYDLLIIRDPDNGYASLEPGLTGMIGGPGGINEKGVAVSVLVSYSWDEIKSTHADGTPIAFRNRMILDCASNIDEALEILNSNKTCGWNFIVSDKDIGYAVEQNINMSYHGTWNDPVESTRPFWSIDHVVRRTNMFIHPELAASQREYYNPSFFPLISMILDLNVCRWENCPASVPWMHYKALSNGIENIWGNMDLDNTMDMFRNVYLGNTDWRFSILQDRGSYIPQHQWVGCPETGDMLVSFANDDKLACENTVHSFNLFDLLESEPP
jgi:hypothetical protein